MAYNLQPLITILEGILDPDQPRWIVDENNPHLHSLLHNATSLQKLLDKSSLTQLDSQIREVAHRAEDIIESHMVRRMLPGSNCVRFTFSEPRLKKVTRQLYSVMEQAKKLMETEDNKMRSSKSSSSAAVGTDSAMERLKLVDKKMPSSSSSSGVVVGIDKDLMKLKDRLTGMQKKLEIVPIVGMGGVGKTTLAQKLYEDKFIVEYFHCRAWTTISQDYNMPQILKSLLRCITGNECEQRIDVLKDMLYKSLYDRKYLIVLDDIWITELWDEINTFFPSNGNGSRIVITTRESDVANYADPSRSQHQVQLLSESESWNLLHQLVFGKEECPHELQVIGRKIAKDCGGLPLAICVIGGLLSKMKRSEDVWWKIGDNVRAEISGSDERFNSILSLSYKHLPNHLKPCFLYMGAFPEDYMIKGSRLVQLWVAEGFVKSNEGRSLEEEAEDWLKSLVDRNLLLVRKYKKDGKPHSYSMHDMWRDICIKKSSEDMFLNGPNKFTFSKPRRMSFHTSSGLEMVNGLTESMSLTRSVISTGLWMAGGLSDAFHAARLLRVLDLMDTPLFNFPTEIFEFFNLRFLGVKCSYMFAVPKGISRLSNLQTLIAFCKFGEPAELWKLSELRYLEAYGIELLKGEEMNYSVLEKLQRISMNQRKTEATTWDGFLKSIPNIKRLSVNDRRRTTSMAIDLSPLHKLENLRLMRILSSPDGSVCHFGVIFPRNTIRKLVLVRCEINSGAWRTLCALHKLEMLSIRACIFKRDEEKCDAEWEATDGDELKSTNGDEFESEVKTCDEECEETDGDEFESTNSDEFESEEETCDEECEETDGDEFESTNGDEFKSEEETCDEEWEATDEDEFESTNGDEFESEEETCDATNGDAFESEEETCDEECEETDGDEFESEEETCDEECEETDGDESDSVVETCEEEWGETDEDEFYSVVENCDGVWELANDDVFCSLQFLSLDDLKLVRWIANENNFPSLRHLRLVSCHDLKKIPSGIGEIPTLQSIELTYCSELANTSAERIKVDQSENGNEDFKVRVVKSIWKFAISLASRF